MSGLRLPPAFDVERLHADLASVPADAWAPHYNEADYGGNWRGAALRSVSGSPVDLSAIPKPASAFRATTLLDACPYFREVLDAFPCPLKAVRLLSLAPGSFIREHSDPALDFEDGEVRIHIPVQTNPDVEFYVAGERMLLEEGCAYYVNVNLTHRVNNRGDCDRVHLVIDAEVNDWVRDLFQRGGPIPRSSQLPPGIAAFRERLWRDSAWQDRLRPIADAREFERQAVRLGVEAGLDLHDGDVGAALQGRAATAPSSWRSVSVWTPTRFFARDGEPWAEWIHTGARPLSEPSFEETVRSSMLAPFPRFSRCEAPLDGAAELYPSGFIFHTSRCGSTLASQMLAALPQVSVVSEAPPVDEAMACGNPEWLRRVILALGRRRTGSETHFAVKLDAWHIHSLPLLRAAFPEVPWVFLFRDPVEVVRSHKRSPGLQSVPGMVDPARVGVDPAECAPGDLAGWCARVLAAICRSAVSFRGEPGGLFVDYRELPDAVPNRIAPHFGIPLGDRDRELMEAATRFDAKNPQMPFQRESRQLSGDGVPELADRLELTSLYERLRST